MITKKSIINIRLVRRLKSLLGKPYHALIDNVMQCMQEMQDCTIVEQISHFIHFM